jgi:hypothetical protein
MYQTTEQHPLSAALPPVDQEVFASMWQLFVHIGRFWDNAPAMATEPLRTQLYTFMGNRIALDPLYHGYYTLAKKVIDGLIAEHGEEAAYARLFTDPGAGQAPPKTALALVRQRVSNEFVAWQLALGGFKAWGATNYCGYIGGAFIPGQAAPYRTGENNT